MALRVSGNGVRQLFGKKEAREANGADSKAHGSPTNGQKTAKSSWAPMSSLSRLAGKATRLVGKAGNAINDFGKNSDWSNSSLHSEELYTAAEREEADYYGYMPVHHEPERKPTPAPHKRPNAGSEQVSLPYSPPAPSQRRRMMTDAEQKAENARARYHNEEPNHMVEEYHANVTTRTSRSATNSRSERTSETPPKIWRDMNAAEMRAENERAEYHNERPNYGKVLDHEAMARAAQNQKLRTRPPTLEEVRASVRQETQKATPQSRSQSRSQRTGNTEDNTPKTSNQPARTNEAPSTRPSTRSNATELAKFRGLIKDIEKEVELVMDYANDLKAQRREARTPGEKARLSAKLTEVNTQGRALLTLRDQANEKIAELTGRERT